MKLVLIVRESNSDCSKVDEPHTHTRPKTQNAESKKIYPRIERCNITRMVCFTLLFEKHDSHRREYMQKRKKNLKYVIHENIFYDHT